MDVSATEPAERRSVGDDRGLRGHPSTHAPVAMQIPGTALRAGLPRHAPS